MTATATSTDQALRAFLRSPDETLAEAARNGDGTAFAELRARYLRPVRRHIDQRTAYANVGASPTGTGPDVLADEVFAEVRDRLAEFTSTQPGTFRAWLYGTVVAAVIEHRADTCAPAQ
jgi:DNA-directed RNA polymerase specialized sigma24 family protein